MRIRDKIKTLNVGDTVVVYREYTSDAAPREGVVEKVGRQYLYARNLKFSREHGGAEFSYQIFPGTMEEFNEWQNTQKRARELASIVSRKIYHLSSEELDVIEQLFRDVHDFKH